MKFGSVPEIAKEQRPWAPVLRIGPPVGYSEDQIGFLEAQVDDQVPDFPGGRAYRVFVELEEGDREALLSGAPLEFAVFGERLQPISVQLWSIAEEANRQLENVTTYIDAETGTKIEDRDISPKILNEKGEPNGNAPKDETHG